ncbi:hypothetical protein BsWGS_03421 [Bradybaena similaris]
MAVTWLVVFLCADFVSSQGGDTGYYFQMRNPSDCDVSGRIYQHGSVIAGPTYHNNCRKQTCNNGQVVSVGQGCLANLNGGVCIPVDSDFEHGCQTLTCHRHVTGYRNSYHFIRTVTRCEDYYGACHDLGSWFAYELNGQLRQHCTCELSNNVIYYRCIGET